MGQYQVAIENRINLFGTIYTQSQTVERDGHVGRSVAVPAAKSGSLTTRTNATDGELTVPDNTFTTAQVVDLYWATGKRVGVVIGTVAGNVCPISGGTGDDLPDAATAVTLMVAHSESFSILNTAHIQTVIGYSIATVATIRFFTSTTLVGQLDVGPATNSFIWDTAMGTDNPLDAQSTITSVTFSHADTSERAVSTSVLLQ